MHCFLYRITVTETSFIAAIFSFLSVFKQVIGILAITINNFMFFS